MPAQFRLDRPNMSFVNVNPASSTTDEEGLRPRPIRGSLMRGGSTSFIPDLMNVDSGTSQLIMGGPVLTDDSVEASAPPPSLRDLGGGNVSSSTSSGGQAGPYSSPFGCSGGVPRGNSYAESLTAPSSPVNPSESSMPPRSNSVGGENLIMRRPRGAVSARKQTQALYQTNPYTLIRSTTTIEISNSSLNNGTNNQCPGQAPQQPQQEFAQGLPPSSSMGSEYNTRMGEINPKLIQQLMLKQECLRRENEDLRKENLNQKRILQDFVKTFNNPEKFQNVSNLLKKKLAERGNEGGGSQ